VSFAQHLDKQLRGFGVRVGAERYLRAVQPRATAPRTHLLNHGWILGGLARISWRTQADIDLLLDAERD
jgi:hypothetical protein